MLSIDHTVADQPEIEAIPQRIFLRNLHEEMLGQSQTVNGTNNTMIGLAAEAVGKEDNYAENTGYVYQYGRSGRGCL